jgi:hypothetical protein
MARGDHEVIRLTWGKTAKAAKVDVRFFVGTDPAFNHITRYEEDEVLLKANDDYMHLPFKTREICRWLNGKVYDYAFLCDTDTYVWIKQLLQSPFEKYDCLGFFHRKIGHTFKYEDVDCEGVKQYYERCYSWPSGGFGYTLSKKAIAAICVAYPNIWAEDMWVGQVLGPLQALGQITEMGTREGNYTGNIFSWHFPKTEFMVKAYDPKYRWMEFMYAKEGRNEL